MALLKTNWQSGEDYTAAVINDTAGRINTLEASSAVLVDAPASAGATGEQGNIAYDDDFFYVCVATDTWVRAALETWP